VTMRYILSYSNNDVFHSIVKANVVASEIEHYLLFCPFYDYDPNDSEESDRGIWFDDPHLPLIEYLPMITSHVRRSALALTVTRQVRLTSYSVVCLVCAATTKAREASPIGIGTAASASRCRTDHVGGRAHVLERAQHHVL